MSLTNRRMPAAITLTIGLVLGALLARAPIPAVRANSGDRFGESILSTGPVMIQLNEGKRVPIAQDAIYYLDYKSGRLLATIPSIQNSSAPGKLLDRFVERDLVADFKINLDGGVRPHFLMTTAALGNYSEGWAPLFVFESTTNQVAVYKIQQQYVGASSVPKFELVELRSFARTATGSEPR